MPRKHEKFTYSYRWRTAPEQWHFGWNHKPINLSNNLRSVLAQMIISGREEGAEDILRKLLRQQEKEQTWSCIGFYSEDGTEFYYTKDLMFPSDIFSEKLAAYKKWKRYIAERNCVLETYSITSGHLLPNGKMSKENEDTVQIKINLHKPCTVKLHHSLNERIFCF